MYDYAQKKESYVLGSGIQNDPTTRMAHIPQAVAGLETRMQDLESAISQLEARIIPILRVPGPSTITEGMKKPLSPLVPLAQNLENINESIEAKIAWLKSITERVEV